MLPFGLRSAPKIFNALADGLHWYLQQSGIQHIQHYLDDFLITAPPNSLQCAMSLRILLYKCSILGIPIAEHKTCSPMTRLVFLGIEIDSESSELRLLLDKLTHLRELLQGWGHRKVCSRRELELLIACLNHVCCKVVRYSRAFLYRMIALLHFCAHQKTHIQLNRGFQSDLAWNGVSFLPPPSHLQSITDTSGSWAAGAWHQQAWFQVCWNKRAHVLSIAAKEMIPIILACHMWGSTWSSCRVLCHCDNQVVVTCLCSHTSQDEDLMHLLRCLAFVEAKHTVFSFPSR